MSEVLIWMFSLLAVMASLLLVITRSILYGAYSLAICLLSVACLYVLLEAEFVGVTQLMIYVGGVIILLLFSIMLTHRLKGQPLVTVHYNRFWAVVLFVVAVSATGTMAWNWSRNFPAAGEAGPAIRQTGIYLMTTYLMPMELVAVLLLLVLVGALTIAGENFRKGVGDE